MHVSNDCSITSTVVIQYSKKKDVEYRSSLHLHNTSLVPSPSHPSFFSTAVRQKLGWEGLGMNEANIILNGLDNRQLYTTQQLGDSFMYSTALYVYLELYIKSCHPHLTTVVIQLASCLL